MEGLTLVDVLNGGGLLVFTWVTYHKLEQMLQVLQRIETRQAVVHTNLRSIADHPEEMDSFPEEAQL